jgi:hypothetical protein
MGSAKHRSGLWLERRLSQPAEAGWIIFERGAIRPGDGSTDLLDHTGGR